MFDVLVFRPGAIARLLIALVVLVTAAVPTAAQTARQAVPAEASQAREKAQAQAATPAAREERARACLAPVSKPQAAQCEAEFGYCAKAASLNLNETYKQLCAGAAAGTRRALPAPPPAPADPLAERERRAAACLKAASRPEVGACEQEFGYCARAAELALGDFYRASCDAMNRSGLAARERTPLLATPTAVVPDADKCREPATKSEVAQCEHQYGYCARRAQVKLNAMYEQYCAGRR